MYFVVSKFLSPLIMPVGLACLGVAVALLLSWRSPWISRFVLLGVLGLLGGLGMGEVAGRLIAPLERAFPIPPESVTADAVVVLAGTVDLARSTPERIEFYDRPERIVEGARLVKGGRAEWLLLTGGSPDPARPEAAEAVFLAVFAEQLGVDPARMVVQKESRTTREDALYTAEVLAERGIRTFFLVTSAFHMPRAVGCFRKAGLDPIPYPVDFRASPSRSDLRAFFPTAGALSTATLALHEYVGRVVYRALGYL